MVQVLAVGINNICSKLFFGKGRMYKNQLVFKYNDVNFYQMLSFNIIDIFILNKVLPSVVNKVAYKTLHKAQTLNSRSKQKLEFSKRLEIRDLRFDI